MKPGRIVGVVHLDAYPDARFTARYDSASPVAAMAGDSPIRSFSAMFRLRSEGPTTPSGFGGGRRYPGDPMTNGAGK